MNSCSECRALPGNFTNAGAARESGIAHVARIIQTARRLLGVLASVSLLAFTTVVPLSSQAQPCFHGGALSENVFGTNCLGQLIAGKARPGSTVFVLLRVTMNDDCAGD